MSFREISAWLAVAVLGWLFIDYSWPLLQARSFEGGTAQAMVAAVIFFTIVLVVAHIAIAVVRGKSNEEDERDRAIDLRAERAGAYALGAVAVFGLFFSLREGDMAYANILFLGLVWSEIFKRLWQVALYRLNG